MHCNKQLRLKAYQRDLTGDIFALIRDPLICESKLIVLNSEHCAGKRWLFESDDRIKWFLYEAAHSLRKNYARTRYNAKSAE
jgi:hypothetical protein